MKFQNIHPDSWVLKFYNGASWVDITSDCVINPFVAFWGFPDNRPETRMANVGQLTFTLNNSAALYMPEVGSPVAGWGKSTPVQFIVTYDGVSYMRFRGRVDTLVPHNEPQTPLTVDVSCLDWLEFSSKFPLLSPQVANNLTADVAIQTILAVMPLNPQAQLLDIGNTLFPSLFDAVSVRTTAYEEFNKLAQSEMGYCYLQHDRVNGEILVFENNTHRNGLNALSRIPKLVADDGFLLKAGSATDYILKANSAIDKIIPALTDAAIINNMLNAVDETYAENIINRLTINAYPKTLGTSLVTLFSLGTDKPIKIASGAARVHHYTFRNPLSGKEISGVGLVAPVATTDYLFNTKSDGTGTDITAYLTLNCTFSSAQATITLTNTYTQVGYITWMKIRGLPIYQDDNMSAILENTTSEQIYGYQDLTIDQVYQQDTDLGEMIGAGIVEANKAPHTRVNSLHFDANISDATMRMFLNCDIGSLIQVIDAQYSINDWFYVQGVNFTLGLTGQINVVLAVKKMLSIASGALSPVGIEFHTATSDALNFGNIPMMDVLSKFSIAFWMKADSLFDAGYILSCVDAVNGFYVFYDSNAPGLFFYHLRFTGGQNNSYLSGAIVPYNTLFHIVIAGDMSVASLPATFYKNGSYTALSGSVLNGGSYIPSNGNIFVMGNRYATGGLYDLAFGGLIKDLRLYDRIITADEDAAIYNGGVPSATVGPLDHLIFQGPCVRTPELANYIGHTLTVDLPVLDNVFGIVGVPNGAPAGVAF
jgi:hypothetical protein